MNTSVQPAFALDRSIEKEAVRCVPDQSIGVALECTGEGDVHPQLLPMGGTCADAVILQHLGSYDEEAAFRALSSLESTGSAHGVENQPVRGSFFTSNSISERFFTIAGNDNGFPAEGRVYVRHLGDYYMPLGDHRPFYT
jgi:hypothetical protein